MQSLFGLALNLSPWTWAATIISSLGFLIMFGIASSKGDYQGLVKTTLDNDKISRAKRNEIK